MNRVLESNQQACVRLVDVTIDDQAVGEFVEQIDPSNLDASELDLFNRPRNLSEFFKLSLIFNSMNFCYWAKLGAKKWAITIDSEPFDGSIALARLLENITLKQPEVLSWVHLSSLKLEDFEEFLASSQGQIPLLEERYQNLTCLADCIQSQYGGNSDQILQRSGSCAQKLLELLVAMPCFYDQSTFADQTVYFWKRAQLQIKMFSDYQQSQTGQPLDNLSTLTAFSDYKVPQILRHLGILAYSPNLAKTIDNYQLIPKDSKEENEIRIATIIAVDKIAAAAKKQGYDLNPAQVDSLLWKRASANKDSMKPYHRTLTAAY